jgi:3-phenylpropionate/trans-cinnamate dioxygenase ferredoxin subunit
METNRSRWIEVARAEEIPDGAIREVSAGATHIVLVNHAGKFYALQADCPHMGGPLAEGTLVDSQIECPWHHYLFDLTTGENSYPKSVYPADLRHTVPGLKTFPVRQVNGRLEVKLAG